MKKLIQKDEKTFIESEYTTGNKAWLAKLVGPDPKFKFKREFLNKQRGGLQIQQVKEGDIIEEVEFSHSGKNSDRRYYMVKDGELEKITERDAIMSFA